MTSDLQKEMRLGSLLIQLGLLSEADLTEAAQLAVELALPLGKVLVMSGFITDRQLQAIVHAQSMLKDQIVTIEVAKIAIRQVSDEGLSWSEALAQCGWTEPELLPANKLGKLLVDAGIINESELEVALESSQQSGLPLGRILMLTRQLSDAVLCSCLNAQVLLRDNKITREQAVAGLHAAHQRRQSIEQTLQEQGNYQPAPKARIKIGEMFVLAGILNDETIMEAIEFGLITDTPVGQVLVKSGNINMQLLDSALKLQEMVDGGTVTPIQSADVLKQSHARAIPVSQAIAEMGLQKNTSTNETVKITDLLKLSGAITEDDVQDAFRMALQNSALMGKILTITGCISDDMLSAVLRCQTLMKQGLLQQDQAIVALNYCQRMRGSLDEALYDLGWSMQKPSLPPKKHTTTVELSGGPLADMLGGLGPQ